MIYARGELGLLVDRRYRMRLLTLSIIGTAVATLALVFGLRHIDAVAGTLLLQSEPVYSLLLATLFARRAPHVPPARRDRDHNHRHRLGDWRVERRLFAGVGGDAGRGDTAALADRACPIVAGYAAAIAAVHDSRPLQLRRRRADAVLAVVDPHAMAQLSDPLVLGTIVATGAVCYFLASLAWYAAISRLSLAWTTALVIPGIPLLSILCAIVFLGERATRRDLIGVLVSISGVLLLVLGAEGVRRAPAIPLRQQRRSINR